MIRTFIVLLVVWSLLSGCQWAESFGTSKVDNPVMGPPPPRVSMREVARDEHALAATAEKEGKAELSTALETPATKAELAQAIFSDATGAKTGISGNQVVATVNGSPIFASDILEPYSKKLEKARKENPPSEFDKLQRVIIHNDLNGHIDRRLLVVALRSTLKKEQLESMDKELKRQFSERLAEMQKKVGAASQSEFEQKLEKEQGVSLAYLRTMDYNYNMAGAYLNTKIGKDKQPHFGRPELLAYYDAHRSDYDVPAEVKWQELEVSFTKHGGKKQAWDVFNQAVQELQSQQGENFNEVVKKYTDGPKPENGGQMGWTRKGSLANKEIERALFELPIGEISAPITGKDSFTLVRIMDRKPPSRIGFDEVQRDIEKTLEKDHHDRLFKETMADLRRKAMIQTIFDDENSENSDNNSGTVKPADDNAGRVQTSGEKAGDGRPRARTERAALPFE